MSYIRLTFLLILSILNKMSFGTDKLDKSLSCLKLFNPFHNREIVAHREEKLQNHYFVHDSRAC